MKRDSTGEARIRLRDRFREQTAAAILVAAEQLFAEEGLQGARMEAIAARAGVAVGTVYNHFDDREALLRELVRSRRDALLAKLDEAVTETDGRPLPDALRRFLQALFSHWAAHYRFLSVLFQSEPPIPPHRGQGATRTMRQEVMARAERLVSRGVAAGELHARGRDLHAAALVGLAWGVLMAALGQQRLDRVEDDVDCVVEIFLHGVGG